MRIGLLTPVQNAALQVILGVGLRAAAVVALFAVLAAAPSCLADDDHDFSGVRFRVARGVDCLLLPVSIEARQHSFLVDTGSAFTAVDRSLRHALGEPLGVETLATSTGTKRVEMFQAPSATLAGRPLSGVSKVVCTDLANVRAVSGNLREGN